MNSQISNETIIATSSNALGNSLTTTLGSGQLFGPGSCVGGPIFNDTTEWYSDDDSGLKQRINRRKLVELQLTDGTKVLKVLRFGDLLDVREVKETNSDGNEVPVVKFDYYADNRQLKTYCVACDLQAFARLFGLTYESFAVAVIQSTAENG